jgi:pyridoxine kinase
VRCRPSIQFNSVRFRNQPRRDSNHCTSNIRPGNHTGYKQFKGRKTPAEEIAELYEGLKQSRLNDFDVLLSGYCPSAGVVEQVGKIARETRFASTQKPGAFFWGTLKT